jgi:YfiR/HmsC-like
VGSDEVATALTGIARAKNIGGHALTVVRPTDGATWGDCQMLFVADGQTSRSGTGLAGIRQLPVLTASDAKGFSRSGGIVEFYVEAGRMRFFINLDAVERSGLRLSSRLLGLATVIRDRDVR